MTQRPEKNVANSVKKSALLQPVERLGHQAKERGALSARVAALELEVRKLRTGVDRSFEDQQTGMREISAAVPADFYDAVHFRVPKKYQEFAVPLSKRALLKKPRWFWIAFRASPGTVWASRGTLTEGGVAWLKSDAPEGSEFVIIPLPGIPGRGGGEGEVPPATEGDADEKDKITVVNSGKKAGKQKFGSH